MTSLHRARLAAAFVWFGLLGLLMIPLVQPGAGQDSNPKDTDTFDRTEVPGVTRNANTLFYVGKIASIEDDRLTVVLADTKEETFQVNDKTRILLDGKRASLSDLRPTDAVKVTTDVGHRDRADMIVVARAERVVEGSSESTEPLDASQQQQTRMQQQQSGRLWEGKLFVAPLLPESAAAQAGLRPGDLILLVDADAALDSDAALRGLQILPTATNPAIVVGGAVGAGARQPGNRNTNTGVVVPGQNPQGVVTPGQTPQEPDRPQPGVDQNDGNFGSPRGRAPASGTRNNGGRPEERN